MAPQPHPLEKAALLGSHPQSPQPHPTVANLPLAPPPREDDSLATGAATSAQTAGAAAAAPPPSSSRRCLICLDDRPPADFARVLRCTHPVCAPCLRALWEHQVMTDSEPFPRCPMPGCASYASDAAASALLAPRVAKRLRQLRGLRPARAADGRRMYCVADGCFEQLPPPPPLPPAGAAGGDAARADDAEHHIVSTCPDCGVDACMRCGCRAHPGAPCAVPLLCARQRRLYNAYAVGRVSACPRCGVHVERDGGCETISCARCKWSFTFTPFRTAAEVEEAAVVEDIAIPEPPAPTVWGTAFSSLFLNGYFMVWGVGFGALAFVNLVDRLSKRPPAWDLLFLFPFVIFGIPSFLIGSVRFFLGCINLVQHVGQPAEGSVYMAFCMVLLGLIMLVLQGAVAYIAEKILLWQWVMFFVPFIVCGSSLVAVACSHLLLLGGRAAWARWQDWRPLEDNGDGDGSEVGEAAGGGLGPDIV